LNYGKVALVTSCYMFQVLLIVSLAIWILTAVNQGVFLPFTGGLILVALVALAAFGKSQGWGLIGTVFRVAVPIASALTFAIWNGHGDTNSITAILVGLILLSIALYGIHGMIFGMFGKRRRRRRREIDD
jgi:hypothetical protein